MENTEIHEHDAAHAVRFNILLCIDGSEESKRGLKYAIKLGKGNDADITLLYIRRTDKGMGPSLDMARKNMLDWGVELPGIRALKDARDQLIEMGFIDMNLSDDSVRKRAYGDPAGSTMKIYTHSSGTSITIKSMVAPSLSAGILDECDLNYYDLTILAMAGPESRRVKGKINWQVTKTVVSQHSGTVLLARDIQENHGHLICVSDERSIQVAKKDAILASRCNCPIHLISVASTKGGLAKAEAAIKKASTAIEASGITVVSQKAVVGHPAEEIIKHGRDFSVIVMADTSISLFQRLFKLSVPYRVLRDAENSVMIIR